MNLRFNSSLSKVILKLSYPIIIGMVSRTLLSFMDTLMVGRLGAVAIASVGLGSITVWVVIFHFFALGTGTQIMTSRRYGEGNDRECGVVLNNALIFSIIASVFIGTMFFVFSRNIFDFVSEDPLVYKYGSTYIRIRIFEVFSFTLISVFAGFYNGVGITRIHMYVMLIVNIMNIFLNYLLIFGKFGFPRLEVTGAAFASTISTYLGVGVIIAISLRKKYRKRFLFLKKIKINLSILTALLKLSSPNALKNIFILSGYMIFLKIIGTLGTRELAASTICLNLSSVSWMPAVGIGVATATLVGQSIGSKNNELAERYSWESIKLSLAIMGTIGIIFIVFPKWIIEIFSSDSIVIQNGISVLRILGVIQFFDALGIILSSSLEGAGKTFFVGISEIFFVWLIFLPLSYLLGIFLGFGIIGSWIGMIAYFIGFDTVLFLDFKKGNWKFYKL
ncbi:MATE family efflux transporter [candidate division KSB1 bacterium]